MSQYLEEAFPESGTPLLPKDALGRSRVRHLIKEINGGNGVSAMYVEEEEEEEEEERTGDRTGGVEPTCRVCVLLYAVYAVGIVQ